MSRQPPSGWRRRRPDREEQRRRVGERDRAKRDDEDFDPAPPSEDDYVIGDRSGLRRLRAPEAVGDALAEFLANSGWGERVRTTRLLSQWPEIVGPSVADHCRPVRIERGELVVEAESPAWATQLTWLEGTIRQRINEAAGEVVVSRVRVTVSPGR